MSKVETAVAKADEGCAFIALRQEPGVLQEILEENLGGGTFKPSDLDQVKVPTGGQIVWSVVNEAGEDDAVKELTGIIVHQSPSQMALYMKAYTGESNPPDCSSRDGVVGVGTPGGDCKTCRYNQWESAESGKGKRCKEHKVLYVLRKGDMLPCAVHIPATSLGNLRKYMTRLLGNGVSVKSAVTCLRLVKAQSGGGITYSQAVFTMAGQLTPEQTNQIRAYAKGFAGILATAQPYAPATSSSTSTEYDDPCPLDEDAPPEENYE